MRVAVVTNRATHYRRPLFECLSVRFETDFYLTARDLEWDRMAADDANVDELPAVSETRPSSLARAIVRGGYDCVVVSLVGRSTLLAAVAAARMARRPLVLWVGIWEHPATAFHRLSRPIARRLYRTADALIVYGPHVARHIAAECGRTEIVLEVPQAVNNDFFRRRVDHAEVAEVRTAFAANTAPVACFVGRLEREKGLETLLHACALTRREQKLVLIGAGSLESDLRGLAAFLGINDNVVFAGPISQRALPAYLQAVDFLVLPSITTRRFKEPWGLVVNEAMNSRLPVIASDAVGAAAAGLVVDGDTGRIVPEGDAAALAVAMDDLASDEQQRLRLGASGAERVLRWNFDAAADAFEEAVAIAIERKEARRARTACA